VDKPQSRARLVVARSPAPGEEIALSREETAHVRARRLSAGDAVTLVDGTGIEARGRLLSVSRAGAHVAVEEIVHAAETETAPQIDLLVAGLRPERLSWIAQKATELAAARLVLVETSRTQSFRASVAGVARLERVVREAAKQCECRRWPQISGPMPLEAALACARGSQRLFLDAMGDSFPQRLVGAVAILVGPEGGWTDAERTAAGEAGWRSAALPAGRLRAETAALAALVLARAALERAAKP